ncbi:hypothetical protein BC830DRAFT_1127680 [Chytriomyces sp. MP71]|nr:hypothetical protein BC830DRAFT_1127680 [Chytriomyces sp. MP71]
MSPAPTRVQATDGRDGRLPHRQFSLGVKSASASSFYGAKGIQGTTEASRPGAESAKWLSLIAAIRHESRRSNCFVVWRICAKQDTAFRIADSSPDPLRVFSFEFDVQKPGLRKFLVTTLEGFWTKYCSLPAHERSYYEVIREHAPCKLYFDLEYAVEFNPRSDSGRMMKVFKQVVMDALLAKFDIKPASVDIVDLSSSSSTKFSRHLIFNIRNAFWKSNAHVGAFVQQFLRTIRTEHRELRTIDSLTSQQQSRLDDLSCLFINTENCSAIFVDEGVYSRNRNFRIVGSSKIGKGSHLLPHPSGSLDMYPNKSKYFIATLVAAVNWSPHSRILTTFAPMAATTVPDKAIAASGKPPWSSVQLSESSLYPQIDAYIARWIDSNTQSRSRAHLKSVSSFSHEKMILYNVSGNRFCFNIGRDHKSNGVYYLLDLKKGVFLQRCHDPDCRHYSSPETELPLHINPFSMVDPIEDTSEVYEDVDEWGNIDDSDLLQLTW